MKGRIFFFFNLQAYFVHPTLDPSPPKPFSRPPHSPQTTRRSVNPVLVLISILSLHWINPDSFCLRKYHFSPCCPSVVIILGLLLAENQVPWMPHLHKIVSALSPLKVMSRCSHVTPWHLYFFIFVFVIVYILFCLAKYIKLPESKMVSLLLLSPASRHLWHRSGIQYLLNEWISEWMNESCLWLFSHVTQLTMSSF